MLINPHNFKLPVKDLTDIFVVADFSRTITTDISQTTWSILAKNDLGPEGYIAGRNALYDEYRVIEVDETLPDATRSALVKEWFSKHLELFIKYEITESLIKRAVDEVNVMIFRPGAKEFIDFLHENKIPLIINSAGIGNFIEAFFKKHHCYYDNIYITSNKLVFKDNQPIGLEKTVVSSLNKDEIELPEEIKAKIASCSLALLLGDELGDLKMAPALGKDVIKVAFYTEENIEKVKAKYDVIIEENEDYFTLSKLIFEEHQ